MFTKWLPATRPDQPDASPFVKKYMAWGAGPRAAQYLIRGAKTRAILLGKFAPETEDVNAVAQPVLRHRIVTNFNAEADGVSAPDIVDHIKNGRVQLMINTPLGRKSMYDEQAMRLAVVAAGFTLGEADQLRFRSEMARNMRSLIDAVNDLEQGFQLLNLVLGDPIDRRIDVVEQRQARHGPASVHLFQSVRVEALDPQQQVQPRQPKQQILQGCRNAGQRLHTGEAAVGEIRS